MPTRTTILLFLILLLLLAPTFAAAKPPAIPRLKPLPPPLPSPTFSVPANFAVGADLSFLRQAEFNGFTFKDYGQSKPGLQLFKDHAYNWIRLRLFNNPTQLPNDLAYTLAEAQAAKKLGYHFLLDLHYSDTWADPAHQSTPLAWANKSHADLITAVRDYTRDTLLAFRNAGASPDIIQIGNEITNGFLWPDAQLPAQWDHFADLLRAAIQGVYDASSTTPSPAATAAGIAPAGATNPQPLILLHFDRGGDPRATKYFFDKIVAYKIPFDVIGLSYYPWAHGSLDDLKANLDLTANTYKKPIFVVECAYNHRPKEYSPAPGRTKPGPFAETPAGQQAFLQAVTEIVLAVPNHLGQGVFYWEPAVAGGAITTRSMFDQNGNGLPAVTVFDPPIKTDSRR